MSQFVHNWFFLYGSYLQSCLNSSRPRKENSGVSVYLLLTILKGMFDLYIYFLQHTDKYEAQQERLRDIREKGLRKVSDMY